MTRGEWMPWDQAHFMSTNSVAPRATRWAIQPRALIADHGLHRLLPASTYAFLLILLGGIVLRLFCLRSALGQQNSDTSVVYLEARHVAHGDLRVFYWGQQYGGTLFQLTAGGLFKVFGSSFILLQAVEVAYWLVACLLLRSIVGRACGFLAG